LKVGVSRQNDEGNPVRLRDENLTWREIDGETVLLDLAGSKYLTVNAAGTTLLHVLVEGADRDQLIAELVEAYDIPAEQAASDVDAFVAALESKGLLVS
jgi:hypothetical protein